MNLKLDAWIYSKLSSIPGSTGCYEGIAPPDASYPLLLFATLDGRPIYELNVRTMNEFSIVARAVNTGYSYSGLSDIADNIEDVLNGSYYDGGTYTIIATRLKQYKKDYQFYDGIRYNYLGGVYNIYIK
jgi:hypothetical protein